MTSNPVDEPVSSSEVMDGSSPILDEQVSKEETLKRLLKTKETSDVILLNLLKFVSNSHLDQLLQSKMNEQQQYNARLAVLKRLIALITAKYIDYYYRNVYHHVNREFLYLFKLTQRVLFSNFNNRAMLLDLLKQYEQSDHVDEFAITLVLVASKKIFKTSSKKSEDTSIIPISKIFESEEFYTMFTQIIMNTTKAGVKLNISSDVWSCIFERIYENNVGYLKGIIETLERAFKRSKQTVGPIIAQMFNVCCNDLELMKNTVLDNIIAEMIKLRAEQVLVKSATDMIIHQTLACPLAIGDELAIKKHYQELLILDWTTKQYLFESIHNYLLSINTESIFTKKSTKPSINTVNCTTFINFLFDYFVAIPPMTENAQTMTSILNILILLFTTYNQQQVGDINLLREKNLATAFQKVLKLEGDEIMEVKKIILYFISTISIELLNENIPAPTLETYCVDTILASEKKKSYRALSLFCLSVLADAILKMNKESVVKTFQQQSKKFVSFLFAKDTIEELTSPKDFLGLSLAIKSLLFSNSYGENFTKLSKIVNSSLSNQIKGDLYWSCCVALSNNSNKHEYQKVLANQILSFGQTSHDQNVLEQVFLEGFYNRLLTDLENEKYDEKRSARFNSEDEKVTNTKIIYSHSSLRFALDTFRDVFINHNQKVEKSTLFKLFIAINHPIVVDNACDTTHNERYNSLILHHLTRVELEEGKHEYRVDDLLEYLITEIDDDSKSSCKSRPYLKQAVNYSIISILLWKHAKFSHRVYEAISLKLKSHVEALFNGNEYDRTDFIVFNRRGDLANEPYHDVDSEVNKHPIFRQGVNPTQYMSEKELARHIRYHLSDKEWEVIQQKEKATKKNLQETRKQLVKENMTKKENHVRQAIQKEVEKIEAILVILQQIADFTVGDKMKIDVVTTNEEATETHHLTHHLKLPWSLALFDVTDLLNKYEYFENLATKAFSILKSVNRNTLIQLDFADENTPKTASRRKNTISNESLAELLAIATFRIGNSFNSESSEQVDSLTRFIPGFDENTTFGDFIIHKIKLQFPNMLEAEEFTCVLPFLESILNRQSVICKPEHRFDSATLTMAMSILSTHAGKSDLTNITRNKIMHICVSEILPFIPHLNKQAFNSMMAMAPYLVDVFHPLTHSVIYSDLENVRLFCLKTLCQYLAKGDLKRLSKENSDEIKFAIYFAQYDSAEEASSLAKQAINEKQYYSFSAEDIDDIVNRTLPLISCDAKYNSYYSRNNACLVLAGALKELATDKNKRNNLIHSILASVTKSFEEKQLKIKSQDDFDPLITISWLLQEITPYTYTKNDLTTVFDFIIQFGFKEMETRFEEEYQTLLDEMVNVGLALVYNHGKDSAVHIVELFEKYINQLQNTSNDFATGSVIVWYGSVAKHFDVNTSMPKIKKAIEQLIDSLVIPSNAVQKSISEALSPLVANIYAKEKDYVINDLVNKRLLQGILFGGINEKKASAKSTGYGMKRGYAWGLAGIMYGCGLNDMYHYCISPINQYLAGTKSEKKGKEGCMLVFECLSHRFLNLFEPYIVEVMPSIINYALSDPAKEVRAAAEQAVSTILSQMTPYGVVQLLPNIIQPTSNDNWRQKSANIRLLGHMAYCAPRQLSGYLPTIIKTLRDAVNETHPDIVEASRRSLERVGGACRSPEISKQVPLLLEAMTNPDHKNIDKVLESLLFTRFTHSIDSASLALLMPVLTRSLNERLTEIKKKACQIIGSISALILDPKRDLLPYMNELIPMLKNILMDPSPQVRASSAKAIGQLCKSVGEENVTGIMQWLHEKLVLPGIEYVTERSGAAQALCEVISAQGVTRLRKSLPTLLSYIEGDNVEEGYMQVFVYLPALMKAQFEPFLEMCLPKILKSLSHPKEGIRETSLQSSRVIIELFTDSAITILVPALREGLESEEWRTRYNCLILLSDLLTRMTTLYGNADEMQHLEDYPIQLSVVERVLSTDLVAHIVSLTFMAMNDINLKTIANKLWKDMVANPPSILKAYLPQIIDCIIKHLNKSEEQRYIAGKTLGELVTKLGERVLSELIPMLQQQLTDNNPETRQGVILGITELMSAATDKQLYPYAPKLTAIVKKGICDSDSIVRDSASGAFDVLCSVLGEKSVKEIVAQLLSDLEKADKPQVVEIASSGMQQLVRVRPNNVLPKLIPALLATSPSQPQLSETQLKTLKDVCESVVEYDHIEEMGSHILPILEKLLLQLASGPYIESVTNVDEEQILILKTIEQALQCLYVEESYTVFELYSSHMVSNDVRVRRASNLFMQMVFNPDRFTEDTITEEFISDGLLPVYEHLITSFNDPDDGVVKCAWHAVDKLISKCLSKELHYQEFIQPTRENIRKLTQVSSTGELIAIDLPAFNKIAKGVEPILNLYLHGLLFGKTPEVRENSALGIGDVIQLTGAKQLSPFVIKITGPLIRVAGDRFPWQVKAAILQTCSSLMDKGALMLKPFLPQLQATFIKGLQDSSSNVLRKYSEQSIPKLIDLGCRVDALVSALNVALKANGLSGKGSSLNDFVVSITRTMTNILVQACDQNKVKGVPFDQCMDTLKKILMITESPECANSLLSKQTVQQDSDKILDICASCLSVCCRGIYLQSGDASVMPFIEEVIDTTDNMYQTFSLMSHFAVDVTLKEKTLEKVQAKIIETSAQSNLIPKVCISLTKAATRIALDNLDNNSKMLAVIKSQYEKAAPTGANANALRYEVAKCVKKLVKAYRANGQYEKMFDFVDIVLQLGVKDKFIPAKLCNERTLFYLLGYADSDQLRVIDDYCTSKKLGAKESKLIEDYGSKVLIKLSNEDSDLDRDEDEEDRIVE